MLHPMRCLCLMSVAMLVTATPALAHARDVRMLCHQETYLCYTDNEQTTSCYWNADDDEEVVVSMTPDERYPNESSPQRVWTGQHQNRIGQTQISLNLTLIESPNGQVGYTNRLRLAVGSVVAETTGVTYIRGALRIGADGTGYTCTITNK